MVAGLLAQMAAVMIITARQQSVTVDETVYVGTAAMYLRDHTLTYNYEHPPLTKLAMAAGLSFADIHTDPAFQGDQWTLGRQVLYERGNDAQHLLLLARLPMIGLTLLFGLVVFLFGRDLAGPYGGLVALALYTFSPDVITFGSLGGVDMPTVGFLLTTLWLLWNARSRPYLCLPFAGIALGAALASKMSALPALPIAALLVMLSVWHAGKARRLGRARPVALLGAGAGAAAGVLVIAFGVVWVTYLIVDPHLRWTTPPDLPVIGGFTGQVIDWLPLPESYRDGMRFQFGLEDDSYSAYVFGHRYPEGVWFYMPAALLIKEPLGMLALWLIGAVAMLANRRVRAAAPYVLVPTLALLGVAMTNARSYGVRYVLFVPVILAVAAAAVAIYRNRWVRGVAALLVLAVVVSSVRTFPYYLPYSNEAFGGTSQTYRQLSDSNVDWGQDLQRLSGYLGEKYPGRRVWLLYRGRGVPKYYGIRQANPLKSPVDQVHGVIAVSATCLISLCRPAGVDEAVAQPAMDELLRTSRQVGDVGHSIFIFERP
ncbi:glycosyltransferase family 39 protein [Actinoplanes regularis]|uniref:glycosyltransferase family 39 protein n=1 Tax=Actinoplanes regularis TaxID=52697 RepID=UPI0024A4EE1D|nr:glycosyltransferase family 39 protein [Actinoplanes regularis]GLW31019.1 glycosyl transferase [Actinoplanes regularis]